MYVSWHVLNSNLVVNVSGCRIPRRTSRVGELMELVIRKRAAHSIEVTALMQLGISSAAQAEVPGSQAVCQARHGLAAYIVEPEASDHTVLTGYLML
jgi:hypothetical protein